MKRYDNDVTAHTRATSSCNSDSFWFSSHFCSSILVFKLFPVCFFSVFPGLAMVQRHSFACVEPPAALEVRSGVLTNILLS